MKKDACEICLKMSKIQKSDLIQKLLPVMPENQLVQSQSIRPGPGGRAPVEEAVVDEAPLTQIFFAK